MTNILVVIINSLKVPKIKKILLYRVGTSSDFATTAEGRKYGSMSARCCNYSLRVLLMMGEGIGTSSNSSTTAKGGIYGFDQCQML